MFHLIIFKIEIKFVGISSYDSFDQFVCASKTNNLILINFDVYETIFYTSCFSIFQNKIIKQHIYINNFRKILIIKS